MVMASGGGGGGSGAAPSGGGGPVPGFGHLGHSLSFSTSAAADDEELEVRTFKKSVQSEMCAYSIDRRLPLRIIHIFLPSGFTLIGRDD